jgi:oligoendopeptidase F
MRLFEESTSTMRFPFEHGGRTELLTQKQILDKLYEPDRDARRAGAAGLTKGLQDNARLLTYILNTLVLDHKSDCELRRFPNPMGPRHLANEITPPVVEALMTATERHHGTVQRYYRLKGKLLGIDPLYDCDRYAPVFADQPSCTWPAARRIVEESYLRSAPRPATSCVSSSTAADRRRARQGSAAAPSRRVRCRACIRTS